ncbi:transmembrane and tpr repeat-containing protein 4 [Plakobranchus ocellatus]|uniref:dolichyl-phosphate-mannose--protein mannosyltransferase n=1 Tax=Plakobranchus ocellatus TaxID=259542 RepID=A0AAV3ZJ77_9GAST|nr:transmembrane and tpr repeat-containing protein 4 [Plakobranchus ocellatus]
MANSNGGHKAGGKTSKALDDGLSIVPASAFVFCVAVLCFVNSYDGEFVFDDTEAVETNQDLLPTTPISSLFYHDFWGKKLGNHSHKSYRPLAVLTFRWNYWLAGGLQSEGFHLVNIVLHGLVCVLMLPVFHFMLGKGFGSSFTKDDSQSLDTFLPRRVSVPVLLCSLLFAVHPVHTESVAGIVGRADLLYAVFFILSFISYVRGCWPASQSSSLSWVVLSMLLCSLATFCKEQGITVIGICSAFDILYVCGVDVGSLLGLQNHSVTPDHSQHNNGTSPKQHSNKSWQKSMVIRHLILVVAGVALLTVRWQIMGSSPPTFQVFDNPHSFVNGSFYRALNYNYLYSINVWILLCPVWLCFDWSMGCIPTVTSISDPRLLAVVALWLAVASLAWACLCAKEPYTRRILTMSVAFMVVPFLPASNLLFRVGFVVAERALYLPSAGFCMLVVIGLQKLTHNRNTRHRSNDWRRGLTLFKAGANVCPLNAKVHYNIAKLTSEVGGSVEQVIAHYRHAVELSPTYDQAMNNLANVLKDEHQEGEAEELLDRAVTISPDFAAAWMNRGIVKAALGKHVEAEYSYKQGLRCRKNYPDCYYNLGNLYVEMKRSQDALEAFHNATRLKPTHWNAWNNAIILLDNLGYYDKASQVGGAALKVLPDHPSVLFSLANVLGKAEKWEESEQMFLRAIRVNANNPGIHLNLGVLYHRWGKLKEAEESYKAALRLDPNHRSANDNYNMLKRKMKNS